MDFIAVDVETAAPDPASICQIGIVNFRAGEVAGRWSRLVNPQCDFHPMNISVHRILPEMVAGEMTIEQVLPAISKLLSGRVVASHTSFDRAALTQAAERSGAIVPDARWLDTARVARRTWSEVSQSGYGLRNVCRLIGHDFAHHDALADAEACGRVLVAASKLTKRTLDEWFTAVDMPIARAVGSREKPVTNPDGHLYGCSIAFTGELSYPREEMVRMACDVGCRVVGGVSKKINFLVVGDGYVTGQHVSDRFMTGKHKLARDLSAQNVPIQIVGEEEFLSMLRAKEGV